ncbi:hypothetical protein HY468_05055 [Candidatus Roizmanbacteria bacterium]|nr:hypothetical protein [Candidatus Roizmanbacteria bacterium]
MSGNTQKEVVEKPMEEKLYEPLPQIVIPEHLQVQLENSTRRIINRFTHKDEHGQWISNADAPDLIIFPLRSGPIAAAGLQAVVARDRIPMPHAIDIPMIGAETRVLYLADRHAQNPAFEDDRNNWESPEAQKAFIAWLQSNSDERVAKSLDQIRASYNRLGTEKPTDHTVRIMVIDDVSSEEGHVRQWIAPAFLKAALGDQSYTSEHQNIFTASNWLVQIVKATFTHSSPVEQHYLEEITKGEVDDKGIFSHNGRGENMVLRDKKGLLDLGEIMQGYYEIGYEPGPTSTTIVNPAETILPRYGVVHLTELTARIKDAIATVTVTRL